MRKPKNPNGERMPEATPPNVLTIAALLLVSWLSATTRNSGSDKKKHPREEDTVEPVQVKTDSN